MFSKENLSKTIPKEKIPTVGDSVYYRNTAQGDKLKDHWLGPYPVVDVNSSGTQVQIQSHRDRIIACNPHQIKMAT